MKILSILRDVANRLSEDKDGCCEKCRDSKRQCLEGLEQAYQEVVYLIPQGVASADSTTSTNQGRPFTDQEIPSKVSNQ